MATFKKSVTYKNSSPWANTRQNNLYLELMSIDQFLQKMTILNMPLKISTAIALTYYHMIYMELQSYGGCLLREIWIL